MERKVRGYWTIDKVREEALKYTIRSSFKNNSASAYQAALKSDWLDDVCSHMSIVNKKENGYWTYDKVRDEALKYATRIDFQKSSTSAYSKAKNNGWLDDVCFHMNDIRKKGGYWTIDKIKEEALKYTTRNDFRKESGSAYTKAQVNGWLDDVCSHMTSISKPNGYWTIDKVREEALKFNNRNDFNKGSSAYQAASKFGWLDDVCSHMELQGSIYKRHIYKAIFDDGSVYIGLTYNYDKRMIDHLRKSKSSVYRYMIQSGLKPTFELITKELLSMEDAVKMECRLIDEYKDLGFNVLNKAKGGSLGGSLIIWTLDKVRKEALKYDKRNDFIKGSPTAYNKAIGFGLLDDVCSHMVSRYKPNGYWTYDNIRKEALNFDNRADFKKDSITAYNRAMKNGWLNDVCSHMNNVKVNIL